MFKMIISLYDIDFNRLQNVKKNYIKQAIFYILIKY